MNYAGSETAAVPAHVGPRNMDAVGPHPHEGPQKVSEDIREPPKGPKGPCRGSKRPGRGLNVTWDAKGTLKGLEGP